MSLKFPPPGKRGDLEIRQWIMRSMAPFPGFFDAVEEPLVNRHDRIAQSKEVVPEASLALKMGDYVGLRVCLRRDLTTNGGNRFLTGEVLVVEGHWRGRLNLVSPDDHLRCIRNVSRQSVEILNGQDIRPRRRHPKRVSGD